MVPNTSKSISYKDLSLSPLQIFLPSEVSRKLSEGMWAKFFLAKYKILCDFLSDQIR